MAGQDNLIVFDAGDKLTAEETNANNQYLENLLTSAADNLTAYVDAQIESATETLENSLTTQISSINNQISVLNKSALKQSAFSKSNNGYLKMSNGLILQWGYFTAPSYRTTKEIPLNIEFTADNYKVFYSSKYEQTAGDKGSSCATRSKTTKKFVFYSGFEGSTPTVYYFAIGY